MTFTAPHSGPRNVMLKGWDSFHISAEKALSGNVNTYTIKQAGRALAHWIHRPDAKSCVPAIPCTYSALRLHAAVKVSVPTSLDQKSMDGTTPYNIVARWNVLDELRIFTEYDVMDAQNIAQAIADPDGEGIDDHWVSTSYELLVGVILHVKYDEQDKSLAGCSTYLADPSFTDPEQMFNRMLDAEHDPEGVMGWKDSMGNPTKTHPQVALAARAML